MSSRRYIRLDEGLFDSSLWDLDPETRCVWLTLLGKADRYGEIKESTPALRRFANVSSIEAVEKAMEIFMAPDRHSRDQNREGRRVEAIPGGWRLINHDKYQHRNTVIERREYKRAHQEARRKDITEIGEKLDSISKLPGRGRLLDEIECPSCGVAGFLLVSPYRRGFTPTFWCRSTGGCGMNFPLNTETILSNMTDRARAAIIDISSKMVDPPPVSSADRRESSARANLKAAVAPW